MLMVACESAGAGSGLNSWPPRHVVASVDGVTQLCAFGAL